jgi:hypothetical protein
MCGRGLVYMYCKQGHVRPAYSTTAAGCGCGPDPWGWGECCPFQSLYCSTLGDAEYSSLWVALTAIGADSPNSMLQGTQPACSSPCATCWHLSSAC